MFYLEGPAETHWSLRYFLGILFVSKKKSRKNIQYDFKEVDDKYFGAANKIPKKILNVHFWQRQQIKSDCFL